MTAANDNRHARKKRAQPALDDDHRRVSAALRRLSDTHRNTVMLARTLLQPAAPTTDGDITVDANSRVRAKFGVGAASGVPEAIAAHPPRELVPFGGGSSPATVPYCQPRRRSPEARETRVSEQDLGSCE